MVTNLRQVTLNCN